MTLRSGEIFFSGQKEGITVPETISLFGLSVSFYGLFLVVAALVGLFVIVREARRKQQNVEGYLTLLTLSVVAALLGARIYYVVFQWHLFVQDPISFLNFRSGGLAYFGALFGVWITIKWFCRKEEGSFTQRADVLSIGAAGAAPFVWLGCVFVREPLGRFYEGWFSVRIGTEYLPGELGRDYSETLVSNMRTVGDTSYVSTHPVALYGIVLSAVVFAVLSFYKRKAKTEGTVFAMYLLLNAVMIVVLEFFRADRCFIWGTEIPVNYVVGGVIILVIGIGYGRAFFHERKNGKKRNFFIRG